MPRPRKTKKTPEVPACNSGMCFHHTFSMKPISADPRDRFQCQLELCPKFNNLTKKHRSILPILNRDSKQYTPCFILDGDETHYTEYDEKYKQAHNLKIGEYEDSNRTILEPKHGRKSKICAVCRAQYADYREHISSVAHKQRLRMSSYNSYIEDLVRSVSSQDKIDHYPQESSECSQSTRNSISVEEYVSKQSRKELKSQQKQIQRSTRWVSGFGDFAASHKSSIFEKGKDSERQEAWQDKTFLNLNKSFHIEDYLI